MLSATNPSRPLKIGLSPRFLHKVPPQLGFRGKTLQYLEQMEEQRCHMQSLGMWSLCLLKWWPIRQTKEFPLLLQ